MTKIDSFPRIMPGESLYSVIACYHSWSGNDAMAHSHEELFGSRGIRATFDLPNFIGKLAARLPEARGLTAEALARDHTLIGYLTAFLPRPDGEAALAKLIAGDPALHLALGVNASVVARPPHLNFCRECLGPMRVQAGRLWWRLDHQLPGVLVCPDHGCVLRRSLVPVASGQFVFVAATEETCPEEAERVVEEHTEKMSGLLREVARRSAKLLSSRSNFESYEEITRHYRTGLRDADLMITEKQLDVPKFTDAFRASMGGLLELLSPCFEKMASPEAWILEMARKQTQAKHPLQHVLFQMFLDSQSRRVQPFGTGPWPCRNPVASHGIGALTVATVKEKREGHGLVGTFECPCGYTYTKSISEDGRQRGPRYKCFGPLLDPALTALVENGATLRGAAAALGIHPRAVAAAAKRLDLGRLWKVPEAAGSRLGRAVALPSKQRRTANPSVSRRPSKPRVDWAEVDAETRAKVRDIVPEIRRAVPPVLVSLREIERRLRGKENWIYLRRVKLPLTMELLSLELEEVGHFQLRRLQYVIERELSEGAFVTASSVTRMASLRHDVWGPKAHELIAALCGEAIGRH